MGINIDIDNLIRVKYTHELSDYRCLSYFVEIVIFLSDAVARQHRIVPADLCISLSLLFPNIRHI